MISCSGQPHFFQPPCLILALFLTACGGGSISIGNFLSAQGDDDSDGLTNSQEMNLGTNPTDPDSDGDRIWDGEEIGMFGTMPTVADSDGDGRSDGAVPQPTTSNIPHPALQYGVFTDNALGSMRVQISDTRYEQNHVVYAPTTASDAPLLIYQTYLADGGFDGKTFDNKFDEGDLPNSAIAVMNIDGSRPRLLTDLDANGKVSNNGAIDATPEPSPDGQYIIFISDRDNPGSTQLRLYVMDMDGKHQRPVSYASTAPDIANVEIDADPDWGVNNTITFKRERLVSPHFSRVYTATIDTTTMTLSNIVLRTDGVDDPLTPAKGDYDPKISPDGGFIASYRRLAATPGLFGDYDIWIGRFSDPIQPTDASLIFLDADPATAHLFPRWNQSGDRLAVWSVDSNNSADPVDIIVFDLTLQTSPFLASVVKMTNITHNGGWIESMPSWNTDPNEPDMLIYSASR
jgi:Tol biopolymer transport system component